MPVTRAMLMFKRRRSAERAEGTTSVTVCVTRPDQRKALMCEGVIEDLSPHGARFITAGPISKGWLASIRLPVGDDLLRVPGRIVRRVRRRSADGMVYEHGIRFDAIDDDVAELIGRYCDANRGVLAAAPAIERVVAAAQTQHVAQDSLTPSTTLATSTFFSS